MSTLRELELVQTSPRLLEVLRRQGIAQLTEFQKQAVVGGIIRGRSQILQTHDYDEAYEIAEIALLNHVSSDFRARVIILCPNPHHAEKRFHSVSQRCTRLGIETTIIARRRAALSPIGRMGRVVVATYRSFSIALRTQPDLLRDVQSVLIDRLDLIGQPNIGVLLEKSIVTIKGASEDIQFISVCPPVADIDALQLWLQSDIIEDMKADIQRIFSVKSFDNVYESLTELTEFTMTKKGQVLLLSAGASAAEELSSILVEGRAGTDKLDLKLSLGHLEELRELASDVLKHYPACDISKKIAKNLRKGVGFLHEGLSREQRRIISNAWESRLLPVLVMPTGFAVASGLKAYTVFVIGVYMQEIGEQKEQGEFTLISEWQLSDVLYSSGRRGFDNRAFGIVVVDNDAERKRVISKYFHTNTDGSIVPLLSEVDSNMDDPENIQDLVMGELCASKDGTDDPFAVVNRTYWAVSTNVREGKESTLSDEAKSIRSHISQRAVRSTITRANEIPNSSVKLVSVTPRKIEGLIHSESRDLWHHVILRNDEGLSCTCESWKYQGIRRHRLCKHLVKFMQYASEKKEIAQYALSVIRKSLAGLEILDELEKTGLIYRVEKRIDCTELGKNVTLLGIPVKDAKRVMKVLSTAKVDLSRILLELAEAHSLVPRNEWERILKIVRESDGKPIEFCDKDTPGTMENCLEDLQYFNSILLGLIDEKQKTLKEQAKAMDTHLKKILDAFS
ncbi:MAG: hypothetical protein ACFFED_03615 [Candidatus Thorarchaeota archaeon]